MQIVALRVCVAHYDGADIILPSVSSALHIYGSCQNEGIIHSSFPIFLIIDDLPFFEYIRHSIERHCLKASNPMRQRIFYASPVKRNRPQYGVFYLIAQAIEILRDLSCKGPGVQVKFMPSQRNHRLHLRHFSHVLLHFLARNAHTFTDGVSFAGERGLHILLACDLRRPSTRFRHGRVQHLRHVLRPAFQFRERRKVLR